MTDHTFVECPVCGTTTTEERAISQNVEGEQMHFCSEGCKDKMWKTIAYSSRSCR